LEWEALSGRLKPYAAAFVFTAAAAAADVLLTAWIPSPIRLVLFMPALAASAALGFGPGAFAFALGLLSSWLLHSIGVAAQAGMLELSLFGASSAVVFAIVRRASSSGDLLFKTVQDISTEGVVVYRAVLAHDGQPIDFEYRYANPAAYAIMKGRPEDVVGGKLLERLPEARDHPQLFPQYARVFATGETSESQYEIGGRWFHSTVAKLRDGIVVTVQDISGRRRSQEVQKLLVQELNHRVKNLFASVLAMVAFTERGTTSVAEFRDKLSARLQALSRTHSLLSEGAWTDAAVRDVVKSTLEPHLDLGSGRFRIDGGDFRVSSDTALALNMALHELATNAAKYGALSTRQGRVGIKWTPDANRPGFIRMTWIESGGPPILAPAGRGFGTTLLERAFAADGGEVHLQYPPDGVFCEMLFASMDAVNPRAV